MLISPPDSLLFVPVSYVYLIALAFIFIQQYYIIAIF